MPTVTCPYCKHQSESKFLHKTHLRNEHAELFANNIRTTITGSEVEVKNTTVHIVPDNDNVSSAVDGSIYISFVHGFHTFIVQLSADNLFDKVVHSLCSFDSGAVDLSDLPSLLVDGEDQYFDARDKVQEVEKDIGGDV